MRSWILLFCLLPAVDIAGRDPVIETADITHFWTAFDELVQAHSRADSIRIIQHGYFDNATPYFREFVKARNFTPEEYVALINSYPAFWKSIRPLTEKISGRRHEIELVFDRLSNALPGFKAPDVCFAIGCLRTGGTTTKDLILIGAEIATADCSIDKTGMNSWLLSVLGNTGDIISMVAHEAVHTQQSGFPFPEFFSLVSHRKLSLLNMAIIEGSADFISMEFLGLNINTAIHAYGDAHRCALWKEFLTDVEADPFDYSKWLYNGNAAVGKPADMAYYIGYIITESYYHQKVDKHHALKTILRRGKYKRIVKQSNFESLNCHE